MTRIAYFDLCSGISGDMILAALAGAGRRLGVPVDDAITEAVAALTLDCSVTFVDDERGGLACLRAEVKTSDARYTATQLRDAIAAHPAAVAALDLLVAAEARVHGVDPSDVHLHELASSDTAADLVGAAVALRTLGVERIAAAYVPVPNGWIRSEHGPLPLPAPVTLEILTGASLVGVDADMELVTPSGAAILMAHGATFGTMPSLVLEAVGVGAGSRITERPNISRVLIGEAAEAAGLFVNGETCVLLETNIDDQTPEGVAHAVESLIARGALDAWITPIVMKKSRPAFLLNVLTTPEAEAELTEAVFRLTTTLGIRRRTTTRSILDRDEVKIDVGGHPVRVKVGRLRGEVLNIAPEFADCARVAEALGTSLHDVSARATELTRTRLEKSET